MEGSRIVPRQRNTVEVSLLVARVIAGIVFVPHGAQKLLGAFGGPGLAAFVQMVGPLGYLVAIAEFFGGLCLIAGVLSRFSAASIILIMLGAIGMVHIPNGFFMNWIGTQKGEGYEYHLLAIGLLQVVMMMGPGRFALARRLSLPKVLE